MVVACVDPVRDGSRCLAAAAKATPSLGERGRVTMCGVLLGRAPEPATEPPGACLARCGAPGRRWRRGRTGGRSGDCPTEESTAPPPGAWLAPCDARAISTGTQRSTAVTRQRRATLLTPRVLPVGQIRARLPKAVSGVRSPHLLQRKRPRSEGTFWTSSFVLDLRAVCVSRANPAALRLVGSRMVTRRTQVAAA